MSEHSDQAHSENRERFESQVRSAYRSSRCKSEDEYVVEMLVAFDRTVAEDAEARRLHASAHS